MAAANGHEDIVRLLLRHGADQSKISSVLLSLTSALVYPIQCT